VFDLPYHLGRMSRRDELAPWKRRYEFVDDLTLPFRVQVQIEHGAFWQSRAEEDRPDDWEERAREEEEKRDD
jgi:hypothetical protein